jgi:membrane protease YdiL (CAAX protease family)
MKPTWSTLYDDVKDRRYALLFLIAMPLLLGIASVVGLIENSPLAQDFPVILFLLGVIVVLWVFGTIWRRRKRRPERWERKKLSSDELRVARSKLKR